VDLLAIIPKATKFVYMRPLCTGHICIEGAGGVVTVTLEAKNFGYEFFLPTTSIPTTSTPSNNLEKETYSIL
jgi:hypothetical protein